MDDVKTNDDKYARWHATTFLQIVITRDAARGA
jgi:hypothetical protein